MPDSASSRAAARRLLGLREDETAAAVERAFRREIGPLARVALADPAASEKMRALIAARARLKAAPEPETPSQPAGSRPARPTPAVAAVRARAFRLLDDGPHVQVDVALEEIMRIAEDGAVEAALRAPVLRRCPLCTRGGRTGCAHCGGTGVAPTARMRFAPLDLERLAADDMRLDADPWSDAAGRAARAGPRLVARLV